MFSKSALFQAGKPLFKQIPGTEYTWHELAVSLAPGTNYKSAQEKVYKAVHTVYDQYRELFEGQFPNVEGHFGAQMRSPAPDAQLQLADTSLELVARYPVEIRRASEMDDRVTRTVVELISSDADLQNAIAGAPKIRAAIKG